MCSYFYQKFEGKIASFFPRFSRLTTTRILLKVLRENNRFINVMKMRISAVNVSAPTRLRNEEENNFSPQFRKERLLSTNPLCLRFGAVFLISLTPKLPLILRGSQNNRSWRINASLSLCFFKQSSATELPATAATRWRNHEENKFPPQFRKGRLLSTNPHFFCGLVLFS